jgi:hypothetical protein
VLCSADGGRKIPVFSAGWSLTLTWVRSSVVVRGVPVTLSATATSLGEQAIVLNRALEQRANRV